MHWSKKTMDSKLPTEHLHHGTVSTKSPTWINYSSRRWRNEKQSLVPNLWFKVLCPKDLLFNLNLLPNLRYIIKTQPRCVSFWNTKLRRWLKKKTSLRTVKKTPPPNTSCEFWLPQRDIWHHNINFLAPRVVVCSVVAVLLRCLKLFFHVLTSNAPVMKREEPNLYQGKGRWGPKWFDQYLWIFLYLRCVYLSEWKAQNEWIRPLIIWLAYFG